MFWKWTCVNFFLLLLLIDGDATVIDLTSPVFSREDALSLKAEADRIHNMLVTGYDPPPDVLLPDPIPTPWEGYAVCQPALKRFGVAVSNFSDCAVKHSIPPMVCMQCLQQYIQLERAYRQLKEANQTVPYDNRTCSETIFSDYAVSFPEQLYQSLVHNVWEKSICSECLSLRVEPNGSRSYAYRETTRAYYAMLRDLRACMDATPAAPCDACWRNYSRLYSYFWDVFIRPEVDFCLDIQATMNDTVQVWRVHLGCAAPRTEPRSSQAFLVAFLTVVVCLLTVIFYAGSFIQGERRARKLKKYSRFNSPLVNDSESEQAEPAPSTSANYGTLDDD